MAQRLQELCALLVEDTCGQLSAQVFTTLAENGRLSRSQLQQITGIPARHLRHLLATLSQLHILLYSSTDDVDVAFYQVDWRNSYALVRSSRVIDIVEERFGEGAGKIVANILQLGHACVGDLVEAFDLSSSAAHDHTGDARAARANGEQQTNGHHASAASQQGAGNRISTIPQLHQMLRTLLQAGFLAKVGKRAFVPAADLQTELEEAVIADQFPDRKISGPKKQTEFQNAVNSLKRKWRDADEYSEQRDTEMAGLRRPGHPSAKRTKLGNGGARLNGNSHDDADGLVAKLPNDLVLQVNYAQCTLALRSHRLEQMAHPFFGGITASVYGALLQVLESKIRARDEKFVILQDAEDEEDELPVASTMEIADAVDPSLDLTVSLKGVGNLSKSMNGGEKKKRPKASLEDSEFGSLGIKQELNSDDDDPGPHGFSSYQDRNNRLSLIEEHLRLLEEHPRGFCTRVGGGGRGEWRVHFPLLTDALIQSEIDATVLSRFGKTHMRILRLLRDKGRLEEKQVAAVAMMRLKNVRPTLTELQFAGFVECQEVPKDGSRQNARTIFLWFHDQQRVQSLLLQHTYQAMARLLQRLKAERDNYKNAIAKAEMMDVKDEKLNQNEQEAVMQWREVEEKLLVQLQRTDELVALLRDFSGKDTSLLS